MSNIDCAVHTSCTYGSGPVTKRMTRAKAAHLRRLLKHSRRLSGERRIRYERMLLSWQAHANVLKAKTRASENTVIPVSDRW